MKLNRLETHDRLLHFKKDQADIISEGCKDCLKKNSLSLALQDRSPYIYIFAHPRTADDGVNKRMLWQPRLGKPSAQENSYLFRAESKTDNLEICWMIPPHEHWKQYEKGNVTEHEYVRWSIHQYKNNRLGLEAPFVEDFNQAKINEILLDIAREMDEDKRMAKLYVKPKELILP